jgi:ABC-type branched-subunit amino acid transport system permease subunit
MLLGLSGLAALLPVAFPGDPYLVQVVTLTMCSVVPAIGLNLLFGYTGLISLGHMGFAGVGAYAAALLMKQAGWGFLPALVAAMGSAGLAGLLVGIPCLRLRSHFFVIVTLAVGLILGTLFNNLDWLTGGAEGLPGIPRPRPLLIGGVRIVLGNATGFYWVALAVTVAALLVQWAVVRSPFGRSLAAIRQDEALAEARGVNVFAHKLAVFALSAAIAGAGGALRACFLRVAAPSSFDLAESINLVAVVILGGAGYQAGPALGSLAFVALPEVLRVANQARLLVFGAMLVLLALFAPRGLLGLATTLRRRMRRSHAQAA